MQKLINPMQNCAWDSKTALTELYGMEDPFSQPMTELWMGVHPKSGSRMYDATRDIVSPRGVTESNKVALLGDAVTKRFGELPFLFKVLYAAQPLSIQVRPSRRNSEINFAKENVTDIPVDAAERNYKGPNHRPELVFVLTPSLAMSTFHEFFEIVSPFQPVTGAHPAIVHSSQQPDTERLGKLLANLLNMQGEEKSRALMILKSALDSQQGESWQATRLISEFYPEDSGLFSPLLLNVMKLDPSGAIFLFAGAPHAYLQDVALEVMANSDSVLHAGLTPGYIDIPELVANMGFEAKPANQLLTQPVEQGAELDFLIPVDDFAFSLHDFSDKEIIISRQSAAILFCIEGGAILRKGPQQLQLRPSEPTFITANESPATVKGHGHSACVYSKL